jgi:hypothetical protein
MLGALDRYGHLSPELDEAIAKTFDQYLNGRGRTRRCRRSRAAETVLLEELLDILSPEDIRGDAADKLEGVLFAGFGEKAARQLGHLDALPLGTPTQPLGGIVIQLHNHGRHGGHRTGTVHSWHGSLRLTRLVAATAGSIDSRESRARGVAAFEGLL